MRYDCAIVALRYLNETPLRRMLKGGGHVGLEQGLSILDRAVDIAFRSDTCVNRAGPELSLMGRVLEWLSDIPESRMQRRLAKHLVWKLSAVMARGELAFWHCLPVVCLLPLLCKASPFVYSESSPEDVLSGTYERFSATAKAGVAPYLADRLGWRAPPRTGPRRSGKTPPRSVLLVASSPGSVGAGRRWARVLREGGHAATLLAPGETSVCVRDGSVELCLSRSWRRAAALRILHPFDAVMTVSGAGYADIAWQGGGRRRPVASPAELVDALALCRDRAPEGPARRWAANVAFKCLQCI